MCCYNRLTATAPTAPSTASWPPQDTTRSTLTTTTTSETSASTASWPPQPLHTPQTPQVMLDATQSEMDEIQGLK